MDIRNAKVLITGADGFIGSHLTEMLVNHGCKVAALSVYNSFNSWGWLDSSPVMDKVEVLSGDVRDPQYCRTIAKDADIIFHLAALIGIPYSYVAPSSYVDTNVVGTLNMCQAALENGCRKFIHTSTSEVYGTALRVPIDENHPLQPQSPYSATKMGADMLAMSYYNAFNLPVTVARPFNTYGPRQSARAIIPTIITQIAMGQTEVNIGNITPTRDFNFVMDTCRGFLSIAESDKSIGEVINIGSGTEISIGDTVKMIAEVMGADVEIIHDAKRTRPERSEVNRLVCDNSKINKMTGFEPKVSLREGLKITADWFTQPENLKRYKIAIYNV
jgi:NAD dependent epimerase/dehydratase